MKLHVRKDDHVIVLTGKDEGKKGKVLNSLPHKGRVIVEGVNIVSRHRKPTREVPQGGIIKQEAPIHSSNVMIVCGSCKKPTRVSHKPMTDGKFVRACKKCGENIDK
ncbi:MAG: 50S ribosomal protein L24 [Firmicutes bacterium]|nr:50S ribosomal protein L24 [candidate division NPL-UPA2 bacterium]